MKKVLFLFLVSVFFHAGAVVMAAEIDDKQDRQITDIYGKIESLKKGIAAADKEVAGVKEAIEGIKAGSERKSGGDETGVQPDSGKEKYFSLESKFGYYSKETEEIEYETVLSTGGFEFGICPVYEIGGSKMVTEIEYAVSYSADIWLFSLSPGYKYIVAPNSEGETEEDGRLKDVKGQELNIAVSADVIGGPEINYIYKPEDKEGVVETTISHSVEAGPVELTAEAMFEAVFNTDYKGFTVCEAVLEAAVPVTGTIEAVLIAEKHFALNYDVAQEEDLFLGLELKFTIY